MITRMINNKEVILRAAANAKWKTDRATQCLNKRLAGKQVIYDKRNILNLAALSIDLNNIPDDKKEEYYDSEVEKIIDAFEGLTDIKPYMDKMYSLVAVDENIDWSNERQVENLLVSLQTNQALSTMSADFPKQTMELYKTHEDVKRVDEIICKSDILSYKVGAMMMKLDFHDQINKLIRIGLTPTSHYGTPASLIETEVTEMVMRGHFSGNNTIMLDAAINEQAKNFFFGKSVEMLNPYDGTLTDSDSYGKCYLSAIEVAARKSAIEQLTITTLKVADDYEFGYGNLLCINGKNINQIRNELKQKGLFGEDAEFAMGKILRDALTDGKSIVTTTRLTPAADGRMKIEHKELKVDLDKLNDIDRKENHYNVFRRFLDRIGLWKIQRFPTNEQREANQAKMRNETKYQDSMRALEDKVFNIYNVTNQINPEKLGHKFLITAIPKITRDDVTLDKQAGAPVNETEPTRVNITDIKLDNEKELSVEPPKELNDRVVKRDNLAK